MKDFFLSALATIILATMHSLCVAQQNNEEEIRNLEKMEGDAFAKKDTATLLKLFLPNLVVNSPLNKVANFSGCYELHKSREN